ncbi:MAG: IS1634 family transposase [Bacteroidota bacterium]|nr:IS1634 family transposase [Bacteroidota bacterium]
MFVRVKSTKNSPRKSVQIVESIRTGNKVFQKIVRYVGIALNDEELEQLKLLAESIKSKLEDNGQILLLNPEELDKIKTKPVTQDIIDDDYNVDIRNLQEEQRLVRGIHDVYGTLFDNQGYKNILKNPARNKSSVEIFKNIVLARIANPLSKKASVDMLEEDFGISLNLDRVYQMMDKLDDSAIEKLNEITYKNTANLFQNKIDIIFFDCTTIYFEAFEEDDLRKNGYSKDLKFNQPQVLLALMVTKEGLPVGYRVFEGSKYEGHTLIPLLKEIKDKYNLDKIVFVADSGMMNEDNLLEMEKHGFKYIVGSRLKNLPDNMKSQVLNKENYKEIKDSEQNYKIAEFNHKNRRLIVNYSEKRAKKDAYDRSKSIEKLKAKLLKKKNPKEYLSNCGNKKYLLLEGEASLVLNEEKINTESQWDGLLGIITNDNKFSYQELLKQYNNLWQVENAFRITKHDLKVRPVFHWKPERVKAHFAISFAAYALVKHLEYRVKLQYKKISPEKIRQLLIRVQTSVLYDSTKNIRYGFPSRVSQDAKKIYNILKIPCCSTPYVIKKCSAHEKIES